MYINTGWQAAIDQNAADGGTLALPMFVFQDRVWWGLQDSTSVNLFAGYLKDQQLAAEAGASAPR